MHIHKQYTHAYTYTRICIFVHLHVHVYMYSTYNIYIYIYTYVNNVMLRYVSYHHVVIYTCVTYVVRERERERERDYAHSLRTCRRVDAPWMHEQIPEGPHSS